MKKITVKNVKHSIAWWFDTWKWNFFYKLLYRVMPINKSLICAISWEGRNFNCNPKAIVDYISGHNDKELKIVVVVDKPQQYKLEYPRIKFVRTRSVGHLIAQLSCHILISNVRMKNFDKRSGQFYIQTWHGMGPKKSEKDTPSSLSEEYINDAIKDCNQTDLMLSGSTWQTKWIKESTWYKGEILEVGTPRDDCFFHAQDYSARKAKVYSAYQIKQDVKLILFAPTFRSIGKIAQNSIDVDALLRAFFEKFGDDCVLLLRLHPNVSNQPLPDVYAKYMSEKVFNATLYPDMQDLLCAADILITDFSSVSTEFVMQDKPCFLFIPDYNTYDRGLYFKPEEMPFPYSYSDKALVECVRTFDFDSYKEKLSSYKERIGMSEEGKACKEILCFLNRIL